MEDGNFGDDDGLFSLPALSVLSIRPFFSGEGVRDSFLPVGAGDSDDPRGTWLIVRLDSAPELLRGASEGRAGRGGLERCV